VVVGGAVTLGAGVAVAGCATGVPAGQSDTPATVAASGTTLGPTSDVPVGSAKIYSSAGVVVTQATAGKFAGFSTVCPHQGCAVAKVEGATIVCPCHGSQFGLDGSVQQGPAPKGLTPEPVAVKGTEITMA
jgi:Rieske Fe-S protein